MHWHTPGKGCWYKTVCRPGYFERGLERKKKIHESVRTTDNHTCCVECMHAHDTPSVMINFEMNNVFIDRDCDTKGQIYDTV